MKNFTLTLFFALAGLLGLSQTMQAQCLQYAGGPYTDQGINVAGCNGESVSAPYEAWNNEIYFTDVVAGGNYTFDICDGYSPTAWGAEALLTVIEGGTPAAGSVTGGTVLGFATGCTITFDATATGRIYFIISTVGGCGSAIQQVDNGTPTVTTNSGSPCAAPVNCGDPTVSAGTISGNTSICVGDTTNLAVTGAVYPNAAPNLKGFCWFVAEADLTGNSTPNTAAGYFGAFPIQPAVPTGTLNYIHNPTATGALPAGNYYFCAAVFGNATNPAGGTPSFNTIVLDAACTQTTCYAVSLLPLGDPSCTDCPVVSFTTVQLCETNQYTVQANVTYTGSTGSFTVNANGVNTTISVNGPYSFGPFASGEAAVLTISNGNATCNQTANFIETCPSACERVTDGGFEDGGTAWTQASTNFGSPLCTEADCGLGGVGPYGGVRWAWFGGIGSAETGSVSQTINIAAPSATLTFYLAIRATTPNAQDFLKVRVGTTEVYNITANSAAEYNDYTMVTVDVSAFANGSNHLLTFESSVFGPGTTSFHVDNISVEACGDVCIADAGTMQNVFVNGNSITAVATGFTTTVGYTYLYLLTNAGGTIVSQSANGAFTITSGSPADYRVYGMVCSDSDLATVLSATTISEIQTLISVIGVCADLTQELSVGIDSPAAGFGVFGITKVQPVPAKDAVTIQFNAAGKPVTAAVYDVTGRLVQQTAAITTAGANTLNLEVSQLASGIYFVTLTDGNNIASTKLVKE